METVFEIPSVVIAIPIFIVLFMVIRKTLQQRPLLGGNADVVLSLCVAALCIISVFRVAPVPTASSSQKSVAAAASEDTSATKPARPVIEFILLPYATLLLALPFVWLIKLFAKPKYRAGNTSEKHFSQTWSNSVLKRKMPTSKSPSKPEPTDRTTC